MGWWMGEGDPGLQIEHSASQTRNPVHRGMWKSSACREELCGEVEHEQLLKQTYNYLCSRRRLAKSSFARWCPEVMCIRIILGIYNKYRVPGSTPDLCQQGWEVRGWVGRANIFISKKMLSANSYAHRSRRFSEQVDIQYCTHTWGRALGQTLRGLQRESRGEWEGSELQHEAFSGGPQEIGMEALKCTQQCILAKWIRGHFWLFMTLMMK